MGLLDWVISWFQKPIVAYPVLFEVHDRVWLSYYADGALEKYFKPWKLRHFEVLPDGQLVCRPHKGSDDKLILHINRFLITLVEFDFEVEGFFIGDRVCIKVECRRDSESGLVTFFRCLLPRYEVYELCEVIRRHCRDHNIDEFLSIFHARQAALGKFKLIDDSSPEDIKSMPRGLARQLDQYERRKEKEKIIARRGAFRGLPVFFTNDLVHGSWWYLFGSLFMTVIASIVLWTTYSDTRLGTDDSILPQLEFRLAWILMILSGLFFTIGSAAFMRAVNDPPMKPLFTCYLISTDELLGAWFFLLGVLPSIPYSIIFLYIERSNLLWGALIVSILCSIGTFLFVLACYPAPNAPHGRSSRCLPVFIRVFGKTKFIMKNCSTDWLLGTWIMFWGTLLATVLTLFYCIYSLASGENTLTNFINITGFVDCIWFLFGSAYFVSGSFSLGALDDDDDDIYTNSSSSKAGRERTNSDRKQGLYKSATQDDNDDSNDTIEISLLGQL